MIFGLSNQSLETMLVGNFCWLIYIRHTNANNSLYLLNILTVSVFLFFQWILEINVGSTPVFCGFSVFYVSLLSPYLVFLCFVCLRPVT